MERGKDGVMRRRLILGRRPGEVLLIGDVRVRIKEIKGFNCRLIIEAPDGVKVLREELLDRPATPKNETKE